LVAQEQDLVLEQCLFDFAKQVVVVDRFRDLDVLQFSAKGAGELFDFHGHSPRLLGLFCGQRSVAIRSLDLVLN